MEFGIFSGYSSRRGFNGRHSLLTGSVIAMNSCFSIKAMNPDLRVMPLCDSSPGVLGRLLETASQAA